jgi:uncharacterized protein
MATDRTFLPRSLDVAAFAQSESVLSGEWPAQELTRLGELGAPEKLPATWSPVRWRVAGRLRPVLGGEPEVWLDLEVQAQVHQTCQRCLQPAAIDLAVDRSYRFVRDEAQAAELDADSDVDVLVISRRFDLQEWVEDELLLALPIVPMHEVCPSALPLPKEEVEDVESSQPNPFAVLQALKGKKPGSGSA